jgi:hypothetical protein
MAQWPAWLVPPAGGTGQGTTSRNRRGVSVGSADASPALPPCDPVRVSGDVDLAVSAVVVKPRATTRIAPLHDLSPGSGDTWLVGRWVRWSVDRLNALDRKTAETIPALEKEASDVKRRVKRAVQRELTNQFPPLQVYLADRAFALDEAKNAEAERARAERDAAANPNAAEEIFEKDIVDAAAARREETAGSPTRRAARQNAAHGGVMTEKHENEHAKTKAEPEEERPKERRKLTDFFVASGGGAKSPSSPANAIPSPAAPPPPTTEEVALDISRASEAVAKRARAETKAEREARWAREGAALAASLAATRLRPKSPKKRDAEKTPRAEARASFPTEPHTSRVPGKERVSRGRAEARAAPVASAPRLALAPPATSPDPPTRLAAPRLAPMEKPRAVGVGPDFDPPRVSAPADRRRGDRDDAARRERRARRAQARGAREKASREDGSGRSLSVFEDVGFARDANPAPEKKDARVAEPRLAPRRAASRETDDAVDRMMARSVRVGVGALRNDDGTPSKHRRRLVLRDEASNGAKNVAAAAAGSSLAAKIKSSLAAAAASAAGALSELAEQAYDGGGEFAADANKENKIRMESVVTVSVDGSDVLVHTREVAVEGKQI